MALKKHELAGLIKLNMATTFAVLNFLLGYFFLRDFDTLPATIAGCVLIAYAVYVWVKLGLIAERLERGRFS